MNPQDSPQQKSKPPASPAQGQGTDPFQSALGSADLPPFSPAANCALLRRTLRRIADGEAESIPGEVLVQLAAKEWLEIIPPELHQAYRAKLAQRRPLVESDLERLKADVDSASSELGRLRAAKHSLWERGWARLGYQTRTTRDRTVREVRLQEDIREHDGRIAAGEMIHGCLSALESKLGAFSHSSVGFVSLSAKGRRILGALSSRAQQIDPLGFAEFEMQIGPLEKALDESCARLDEFLAAFHKSRIPPDHRTQQMALVLSLRPEEPQYLMTRAIELAERLYGRGWHSVDRFCVAGQAAAVAGEPPSIAESLQETAQGFQKLDRSLGVSYETLLEAARILALPGTSQTDKTETLGGYYRSLARNGIRKTPWAMLILAVRFTSMTYRDEKPLTDPQIDAVVQKCRSIKQELIHLGAKDSIDLSLAAIRLYSTNGRIPSPSAQCLEGLHLMGKYNWKEKTSYYPVAAAVAALGSPMEPRVETLREIYGRLEQRGFNGDHTGDALQILLSVHDKLAQLRACGAQVPDWV